MSYGWLGDFVELGDVAPQQAADLLTMAGVEVSSVRVLDLSEIVVGRVTTQTPHPTSNKALWVHQVDLGDRTEQIVAGAPNAVPGSLVAVALPGTTVPSGTYVRDAVIAGVAGRGMLCSEAELQLGDGAGGIMILDGGRPGQSLVELFPVEAMFEVEVTPNRPDCLCHFGVARELAAALGRPLARDFMPPFTGGIDPPGTDLVGVSIADPRLCRRYIGAVISDVHVAPSPRWLQRRLRAAGVRPINNVVDITNYVLLEYGQPLHAFDLARLKGPEIKVRSAAEGEELLCLDGVTRRLTPEMLVIADADRAVALAGLIGGEETAVSASTSEVLLESATFNGPNVRASSRALNLRTEASTRFEKTLSPELALAGARRAAALFQEVAGAHVHREWVDVYPDPQDPVRVRLAPDVLDRILGVHVPLEDSESILQRLGFHVRVEVDGTWDVLPPVFRLDVTIPEDIVEEVGRIYGYDRVPSTLPASGHEHWVPVRPADPAVALRQVLVGAGLTEVITPGLTSARRLERLGLGAGMLRVANPLSDEMDAVRPALLPMVLQAAQLNVSRTALTPRLFEMGTVFVDSRGRGAAEHQSICAVLPTGATPADGRRAYLRLKSVLDRCSSELAAAALGYERAQGAGYHPGRCASVLAEGKSLGTLGELHPALLRQLDLDGRAAAFELDLDAWLSTVRPRGFRALPRFPAVDRDLSVAVGESVSTAALQSTVEASGGELLESVRAFDEYRGEQVEPGFKSIAFALTFRHPERTLTDSEVQPAMDAIRQSLEREFAARVRGRD